MEDQKHWRLRELNSLKEWTRRCKTNANKHGFEITWERDGAMTPLEALMLVVTELSEAAEIYRRQGKDWRPEFEEEIADVFIRLFHLCGDLDIDVEYVLNKKMMINAMRPYKHNKIT